MKAKIAVAVLAAIILSSCAGFMKVSDVMLPLHYGLISTDSVIKNIAFQEYSALNPQEKQKTLNNIAAIIGREQDPDTQMRALWALRELEAGPSVIIPLILAVKSNTELKIYNAILNYIREAKPAGPEQLSEFFPLIKDASWQVAFLAMTAVSRMGDAAKSAVPELAEAMRRFGGDASRYFSTFDFIAMIDPAIAIKLVIADLLNPDSSIRRNAAEKLFEIQIYMGPKVKKGGEVLQALIRALFSGDKQLSDIAKQALSEVTDPEAKKAMESFFRTGAAAIEMLSKITGHSPQESYRKQEQEVLESIRKFYREHGREEEAMKIK